MGLNLRTLSGIIAILATTLLVSSSFARQDVAPIGVMAGSDVVKPITSVSFTPTCIPDWQVVSSPRPGTVNGLYAVSTVSANDIWAVGYFKNAIPGPALTLVLHWDGSQWSQMPSPSPGTGPGGSGLYSVAAISSDDIWAVGAADYGSGATTLTEHWDGTQWSHVPSPNIGAGQTYLQGVAALATNDVWAVGDYGYPASQTLALHWDGSQWTQLPTPNLSRSTQLYGVTAIAPDDVWAVGYYRTSLFLSLTIHWDGTQWSVIPNPTSTSLDSALLSVAATSTSDVWAVGSYLLANHLYYRSLILHWDGTQWVEFAVPDFDHGSRIYGVAALSTTDAWAVGQANLSSTMLLHWNGISWDNVPFATGSVSSEFDGTAMVSANDVWAIGADNVTSEGGWTLSAHYAGGCATVIPTPTRTGTPATSTPTPTYTYTPTMTATKQPILVSHVNWEARPSQPNQLQVLPITLTLKSGMTEVNYPTQLTDQYGFFTVTLGSLPRGTYTWRVDDAASAQHAPNYLANSGVVGIGGVGGAPLTNVDMGVMRTGDASNDNWVNISDFNILKVSFDSECGSPIYDNRTDFTGDCYVNISDFTPLKRNFGQDGAPPISPGQP